MRLIIKNKMFSLRGSSKILDEEKKPKFLVKGKIFTLTKKKRICDLEGNVLYRVRNKYWHFWFDRYAYIDDAEGNRVAKVKLKFGVRKRFFIEGYQDEISIEGNFWGWNYSILKNGEVIGSLARNINLMVDSFTLNIDSEEDAAFLVAVVIAVDNIFDKQVNDND